MATPAAGVWPRWVRVGAVGLAAAYGIGVLVVLVARDPRVTSYLTASSVATSLGLIAGLGLILLGGVLTVTERTRGIGPVAVLLGLVWLAPAWFAWGDGPGWVRSTAAVVTPMLVAVLVHVTVQAHVGLPSARARGAVTTAYALVGVVVLVRALVHEPQRDFFCWVDCGPDANVFLLSTDMDLASALTTTLLALTVLLGATVGATSLARLAVTGVRLDAGTMVAGPASVALLAEAGYAAVLLGDRLERFEGSAGLLLFIARACALVLLALGLAWVGGSARTIRFRMARLAHELAENQEPGAFEGHLSRSLADGGLEVHYWSARTQRYVDSAGRPVERGEHDPREVTGLVRGGEPVAVVLHDGERVSRKELEEQVGPAARLILDNERLRAEWLAQVEELRLSRARIVASADAHRRALERDLHDGAQQRLIAATFELRLATDDAATSGDHRSAAQLEAAAQRAATALRELRDFAHGVFPAILDEAGVEEALMSLADTAAVPVDVDVRLRGRPGPATERAVYFVARTAVDTAADEQTPLTVRLFEEEGVVVVEVDGVEPADVGHLEDRLVAAGGSLAVEDGRLRAVVP